MTTEIDVEEARPGILVLRLNRPGKLNAMTAELIDGLHAFLSSIREDSKVRAVVLTGAGRAFCAGFDFRGYGAPATAPEEPEGRPQAGLRVQQQIADLGEAFRRVRAPVIGAISGAAAGGGMALSLFCDVRLAASSAVFHASFIRRGLGGCDIGVSWLLPRIIGFSRAADLLLTGGSVTAQEAERIGLVSTVVDDDKLLQAALDWKPRASTTRRCRRNGHPCTRTGEHAR